ncbi:hypothetical protein N1851_010597 [Merluccius polli]|uniref:Uncharacterized protein n=1 Tax=Merluccius polli TaxID=89951 RepID=A0AA47MZC2_MERPO|nr:hypothetical protein N1851_010597 [Merluccius polli]
MDGDEFDASLISRVCNRYYEHVKWELKLHVENKLEEDQRAKALNNRRHSCFLFQHLNAHKAVAEQVLQKEDCRLLKDVPACLMSDDDRQTWRVSLPEWRATRLNDILHNCQQQLTAEQLLQDGTPEGGQWCGQQERAQGVKDLYLKDNSSSKLYSKEHYLSGSSLSKVRSVIESCFFELQSVCTDPASRVCLCGYKR